MAIVVWLCSASQAGAFATSSVYAFRPITASTAFARDTPGTNGNIRSSKPGYIRINITMKADHLDTVFQSSVRGNFLPVRKAITA